eukprot:g8631.t1
MAELCHVCDLFRVALFGPTNGANEDHLDDALGNDLPRPMADAPATMGVRSTRNRQGTALTAVAKPKPVSQLSGGAGATATPSVASEATGPRSSGEAAAAGAPAATAAGGSALAPAAGTAVAAPEAAAAPAPAAAAPAKPVPKTKFSKRASRGLKSAPAYMSFDDVDVEDDDSDGELFIEDSRDHRRGSASASRSPGTKAASAYTVNAPSVYRAPTLGPPAAAAPVPPSTSSTHVAAEALAGAIAVASGDGDERPYGSSGGAAAADEATTAAAGAAWEAGDSGSLQAAAPAAGDEHDANMNMHESMSSQRAIAPDSSAEVFSSGTGVKGGLAGGLRLGGERMSIPRDGSTLESARPHGQSESFHGYKGYPGYEPDTPVAQQLTQQDHHDPMDSLTINPGAEVSDPRQKHAGAAGPTPSSVRYPSRDDVDAAGSDMGMAGAPTPMDRQGPVTMDNGYAQDPLPPHYNQQHHQQRHQQRHQQVISPSVTTSMEMATGLRPPEPRGRGGQVEVTTRQQRDSAAAGHGGDVYGHSGVGQMSAAHDVPYRSEAGDNTSAYGGGGGGNQGPTSPSLSQANSMASSFRNIQQVPSEDGMGSVLGTLAGTEDSANEDLQWKRSALKKFHKVMVKGEGLRVVKHNRSGGSQMRIIRYDPEMKALVWNSKRYMKKAGSANVPIVGIKRVGREGNTVSVTAAGRGTIGFEPQRIRDAKILAEALRALVDKEERSAMWRG